MSIPFGALGPRGGSYRRRTTSARLTEPSDVAAAVLYLASDDASFLTGVCLDIDGGRSIS